MTEIDDLDLHMIQICKPSKAGKSLSSNPERAVLMAKFAMVFCQKDVTQVRMLRDGRELLSELVDDADFSGSG